MKHIRLLALTSLFLLFSCGKESLLDSASSSESFPQSDSESTEKKTPMSEEEASYTVTERTFEKDGEKIVGDYYLPEKEGKLPLIILCHSAFLSGKSLRSYAAFFAKHGYVAYAFDFRGGSNTSRSDGKVSDMTIFTEVDDLQTVYQGLVADSNIDRENVSILGSSQGGLVATVFATEQKENIKGLYLFYPAFNIPEQVKNASFSGPYGQAFIDTLKDYDPYSKMSDFKNPVDIFHGTKDFTVPISYSEKACQCFPNATLYSVEGASHGFNRDNYSLSGNYDFDVFSTLETLI